MRKLIIAIMLLLTLTACRNDSAPEQTSDLTGTLTIALNRGTVIGNGQPYKLNEHIQGPIYDKLRQFARLHPDVSIQLIDYNFITGAPSYIPQDPLPDLIEVTPHQLRWVAEPGQLEDLEPVVPILRWDGAMASLIDRLKTDGAVRMLPVKIEPMIVYYDERIFGQLNLEPPSGDWTWEQFVDASAILRNNGFLTSIPAKYDAVEHIVHGLGGSYTSGDGMHLINYMNGDATLSAFGQLMEDVQFERTMGAKADGNTMLGLGRPTELHSLLEANPDLRIAGMPAFPDGQRYNTMMTTGLALTKESSNKQAAIELLRLLAGENEEEALSFATYNALAMKQPRFRDKPVLQQEELLDVMAAEAAHSTATTFQLNAEVINSYGILNTKPGVFADSFPGLYAPDSAESVLDTLAETVEAMFSSQRGNW